MKSKVSLAAAICLGGSLTPADAAEYIGWHAEWSYMHPTDGVDPAIADPDFEATWLLSEPQFQSSYDGPMFGAVPAVAGPPVDSGVGPAVIGYGAIDVANSMFGTGIATMLTAPAAGSRYTAYFRHVFTLAQPTADLTIELIADDGAAIYVDGAFLVQNNFSAAEGYTALANNSTPTNSEGVVHLLTGLGMLQAGEHTIAVSVHNAANGSSDLGFALRLHDEPLAPVQLGSIQFGGGNQPLFLIDSNTFAWVADAANPGFFNLNNGNGGTLVSQAVDLTGINDAFFSMSFTASENSGGSNFEPQDVFNAYLSVDQPGGIFAIPLAPAADDADGDMRLNGDEFGPGVPVADSVVYNRTLSAVIPSDATSVQLVITAVNNSNSETFRFGDVLFTNAPPPPPPGIMIASIGFSGGGAELVIEISGAQAGADYLLEQQTDGIGPAGWGPVAGQTALGDTVTFFVTPPAGVDSVHYRAIEIAP